MKWRIGDLCLLATLTFTLGAQTQTGQDEFSATRATSINRSYHVLRDIKNNLIQIDPKQIRFNINQCMHEEQIKIRSSVQREYLTTLVGWRSNDYDGRDAFDPREASRCQDVCLKLSSRYLKTNLTLGGIIL